MIVPDKNDKHILRGVLMDLGKLTIDDFSTRIGDEFRITSDGEDTISLELDSAETTARAGEARRADTAFSVIFRGSPDQVLPQSTYEFEHDDMGVVPLFIVPVSQDEKGTYYEAVFTRLDA